jgi:peptidoglycan-associated lipoprotein
MKRISKTLVTLLPIALLAGCATNGQKAAKLDTAPAAAEAEKPAKAQAEETPITPAQVQQMETDPVRKSTGPQAERVIYFNFDQSSINNEYVHIIKAHAAYLANHPHVHVRLEGYADERGTREYNMALGERRDDSVLKLLTLQGVSKEQIQTVSYGEDDPAAPGHDESAWRLNRRVKIVYL